MAQDSIYALRQMARYAEVSLPMPHSLATADSFCVRFKPIGRVTQY
jgi:hypothetical protein